MNRRGFLSGLGAALATVALATRLAHLPPKLAAPAPEYLTDPDHWWLPVDAHGVTYYVPLYGFPGEYIEVRGSEI
jgi:predicted cobalt transporter CbtA